MKKYSANDIIALAIEAGQKAIEVRKKGLKIKIKKDKSKVTNADEAADEIIRAGLQTFDPATPIISEEDNNKVANGEYKTAWVVDPIDGTSSFIKELPDYGVLIARVVDNVPVDGVAYYPEFNLVYYTDGDRAYKRSVVVDEQGTVEMGRPMELITEKTMAPTLRYGQFIADLSHRFPKGSTAEKFIGPSNSIAIIEGSLDVAVNPDTMGDWDLAAVDAILRKSGGGFVSASTQKLLEYGLPRSPERAFLQDVSIAGNKGTLIDFELGDESIGHSKQSGIV